ncbi:hypothetical protein BJ508DRAFT_333325 [Ascobolus immersus RN42]|uniref:Uncharacterized protein n=1 Tax=Ascobolus immersus RN42 TaxID=1160509 RepID=A0A3N4HLU9_ASCIM|nr:hypothetical protein BJ508DRAFT_333325 [Ascobolus immersus RN42]
MPRTPQSSRTRASRIAAPRSPRMPRTPQSSRARTSRAEMTPHGQAAYGQATSRIAVPRTPQSSRTWLSHIAELSRDKVAEAFAVLSVKSSTQPANEHPSTKPYPNELNEPNELREPNEPDDLPKLHKAA